MPLSLSGACRCGVVVFTLDSHTPQPYQLCYCSICRKTAGEGGFTINIMGVAATLVVTGREAIGIYHADMVQPDGSVAPSAAERHFCTRCASALWLYDERWPELVHPFAGVIDTPLPRPSSRVHIMLADKPDWVMADIRPEDERFEGYPAQSIEDWHRSRGLWLD